MFILLQYLCYCLTNFDEISHDNGYAPSQADEWPKSLTIYKSKLTDGGQLENWDKSQFPSILYRKTAKKVQITVFMTNAWNIQTFTIFLLTLTNFWCNCTWQGIFTSPSWWATKSLRILKSKLTDGDQLKNCEKFQFPSILYPKAANTLQITVFMPN